MDLRLPIHLGTPYESGSQQARVTTEAWAASQLACPSCGGRLRPLRANTKSTDLRCLACGEPYQLKSQSRQFSKRLLGAEYKTTLHAVRSGTHPSMILLRYEPSKMTVQDVEVIHRSWITESAIVPRKPLKPTARRAGWQGCSLALDRIPTPARIAVVRNEHPAAIREIRDRWHTARRISSSSASSRGWLADVLAVVDRLGEEFTLEQAYAHERTLASLHPRNRHILPKIRQQLQVARDIGVIEFLGRGRYRKVHSRNPEAG